MIYILDGARHFCSLPAYLCQAIGWLCGQIGCTNLKGVCKHIGSFVKAFFGRPLSSYVIVSFIIHALEILCGYKGLFAREDSTPACEFTLIQGVTPTIWAAVQVAMAALGLIFAPYMQFAVWNKLMEIMKLQDNIDSPDITFDKKNRKIIPKKWVKDSFKDVFLYNPVVLLYFVAQLIHLVWSSWALHLVRTQGTCDNLLADTAMVLGVISFSISFLYCFIWYKCECCARSVTMTREEEAIATNEYDPVNSGLEEAILEEGEASLASEKNSPLVN